MTILTTTKSITEKKPLLIVICGPTASGKTPLAIELARKFNGEIISADSRQFYSELNIGTAKPSQNELSEVKHHFIDSLHLDQSYSAGEFERDASGIVRHLIGKKITPFAVGGSGLYLKALTVGLDDLPSDNELRQKLEILFEKEGIEGLKALLSELDPEALESIDSQNPVRLVRAIELVSLSEEPLREIRRRKPKEREFDTLKIGLKMDRKKLYQRIDQRVDKMMENGLVEEARTLVEHRDKKALQTVGYQELFPYFDGDYDLEEAVRLIKRNSRRYAKRQITWFGKDPEIHWFEPEEIEKIVKLISNRMGLKSFTPTLKTPGN